MSSSRTTRNNNLETWTECNLLLRNRFQISFDHRRQRRRRRRVMLKLTTWHRDLSIERAWRRRRHARRTLLVMRVIHASSVAVDVVAVVAAAVVIDGIKVVRVPFAMHCRRRRLWQLQLLLRRRRSRAQSIDHIELLQQLDAVLELHQSTRFLKFDNR